MPICRECKDENAKVEVRTSIGILPNGFDWESWYFCSECWRNKKPHWEDSYRLGYWKSSSMKFHNDHMDSSSDGENYLSDEDNWLLEKSS